MKIDQCKILNKSSLLLCTFIQMPLHIFLTASRAAPTPATRVLPLPCAAVLSLSPLFPLAIPQRQRPVADPHHTLHTSRQVCAHAHNIPAHFHTVPVAGCSMLLVAPRILAGLVELETVLAVRDRMRVSFVAAAIERSPCLLQRGDQPSQLLHRRSRLYFLPPFLSRVRL